MRITVLLVCFLLVPTALSAKDDTPVASFPSKLLGTWKGPATVKRPGQADMSFPMELHVEPIEGRDSWTWKVIYGEGEKRQVRPYELLATKDDPHHFQIDEKNSIVIDAYHIDGRLYSRFWVADNMIDATYERSGDNLICTLVTYGAKPVVMTGGKGRVPRVASYELRAVQRAVLKKSR